MSVPRSVVKFKRGNVVYTSSVDRASYTIVELSRAAMRDVGKFVVRKCNAEAKKLRGMSKYRGGHHRIMGKTSTFLYDVPWAKNGELPHLEIGITDDTWYGVLQELGSEGHPKKGILRNTTYNNIKTIIEIESQYLSALEDEAKAAAEISEKEYSGGAE